MGSELKYDFVNSDSRWAIFRENKRIGSFEKQEDANNYVKCVNNHEAMKNMLDELVEAWKEVQMLEIDMSMQHNFLEKYYKHDCGYEEDEIMERNSRFHDSGREHQLLVEGLLKRAKELQEHEK